MRLNAEVAISRDLLDELATAAATMPDAIDQYARREVRPFASQWVDRTLRRAPGPAKHPIQWTPSKHPEDADKPPNTRWGYYSRQKAKFFATNGFGGGIPYTRSGKFVSGWHVRADYEGGLSSIRVYHEDEVEQFITGRHQQQFHRNTGWPSSIEQLQALSLALNDFIEDGLPHVVQQHLKGVQP